MRGFDFGRTFTPMFGARVKRDSPRTPKSYFAPVVILAGAFRFSQPSHTGTYNRRGGITGRYLSCAGPAFCPSSK